jgi:hypothetical protein
MIKSNGGIIGPDNVTTGGAFGTASGVFKLGEVTDLIRESKWPTEGPPTTVSNSCRFNRGSSDNLTLSGSSGGSTTKFTRSFWLKKSALTLQQYLMDNSGETQIFFKLNADDTVTLGIYASSAYSTELVGNANLMRDPSAWYHIVIAVDYTNATQAYRARIYINNSEVTSFSTETRPGNTSTTFNTFNSSKTHYISGTSGGSHMFGGYLAEVVHIDGQQLTPSSFGETNSDSGIWVPKDVSGLTFGTKGFYLDFEDSSALGNDVSGNNLDYTANNLTSLDQSIDTPNNNFATMNPLDVSLPSTFALSEGNLDTLMNGINSNDYPRAYSNIQVASGKWYVECKITEEGDSGAIGISARSGTSYVNVGGTNYDYLGINAHDYRYYHDGTKMNNNSSSSYGTTWDGGDTIGIALDMDNLAVYFSLNGTFQASGDPTSGSSRTNAAFNLTAVASTPNGSYKFAFGTQGGTNVQGQWNFGSPPYAISSGNTDGNGFGNFEYAVPSGYLSLCTNNLNSI